MGQETSKLRKQKTIDEFINVYLTLQKTEEKVTQILVKNNSTKSVRTITKYWREVLEKVQYVQKVERVGSD